ncbi:uncharacterized protein LOC124285786 isoform X1 [Haliotis rubra]|uniref:uncharacterized protein LOC124285786 isoform X1 n=1 Tax=Haliotis rubra TaxID=36100 RepID=UPI001EE4F35C|nr:uncharacterized protein LOC124285786 isoform X1 [Haliotis rubra]
MNEVNSAVAGRPQHRTVMNEVNSAVAGRPQQRTVGDSSFIIHAVNSTVSVQPPRDSSSGRRDDFRFENIKASSKQHLKTFDKRRFVETRAYDEARFRLQNLGVVVIVGPRGSGKTTMGANLLNSFTRTPIILHSPEDWYTLPLRQSQRNRLNVLVDNIFGFDNLDVYRKEAWLQLLDVMFSQVQLGLVSVVILLSTDVFNICREQLTRFSLFQVAHIISLSDPKYSLNLEEMKQMAKIHIKTTSSQVDQNNISMHLSKLNSMAFPLICHTFASCKEAQERGLQYFQNPVECIVKRFKILREQNDLQYLVLVLLAVMKGRLPESFFYPDQQSSEMKDTALVLKRVGHVFPLVVDIDMIKKLKHTTDSMVGEYLIYSKRDKSYAYLTALYYDSILLTVAGCHVKDVIDICPSRFLVQYMPLCNPSERCLGVQVQRELFKSLARRIASELTEGGFLHNFEPPSSEGWKVCKCFSKRSPGTRGMYTYLPEKNWFLPGSQKSLVCHGIFECVQSTYDI